MEKNRTNATFVTLHPSVMPFEDTFEKRTGEKLNKCTECDLAFFQANNLTRHLKRHSGGDLLRSVPFVTVSDSKGFMLGTSATVYWIH